MKMGNSLFGVTDGTTCLTGSGGEEKLKPFATSTNCDDGKGGDGSISMYGVFVQGIVY